MTSLRSAVEEAVRSTDLDGDRLLWRGQPVVTLPAGVTARVDVAALRAHQVAALARLLYAAIYRPPVGRAGMHATAAVRGESSPLAAALLAANRASARWQERGVVVSAGTPTTVRYRDLDVRCHGDAVRSLHGHALRAGDAVEVLCPAGSVVVNPGFYTATSGDPDGGARHGRARFYWNVNPSAAARLVEEVTATLGEGGIAYTLKLPLEVSGYDRPDAAVLYVGHGDATAVRALIPCMWRAVRDGLHPAIPALTLRLADGLAFAEQPPAGASFGMHRMGLLADAVAAVLLAGVRGGTRRAALVLERLVASGLDPARPHVNPGSSLVMRPLSARERGIGNRRVAVAVSDDLVAVAVAIARRLSAAAVRWEGGCTWLGAEATSDGSPSRALRTLGPLLHDGTAGIALALAEIGVHADEAELRDAADCAMRHALGAARTLPAASVGLHAGIAGIAIAGLRVGHLLDRAEHGERAVALLRAVTLPDSVEPDLLSGVAGLCLGMLIAAGATGDDMLHARAVSLGARLLQAAARSPRGWSWTSPSAPAGRVRNLCGLSHGAAGIALALAELAAATRDGVWREAVPAAHAYEQSWYEETEANWPDFRDPATQRSSGFMVAWCHGAAGIVLERLHVAALLQDDRARDDARAGTVSLRRWVTRALGRHTDFSLCHGVAGNAEALAAAGARLGNAADVDVALGALADGANRYERASLPWPGGHRAGATPSLMLGDAGIALALLRARVRSVPSVLLPVPPLRDGGLGDSG